MRTRIPEPRRRRLNETRENEERRDEGIPQARHEAHDVQTQEDVHALHVGPYLWWPRMFMIGSFLYFLFGSRPYKVHRNQVTVIERETGKEAGDLTEAELISAMRRLGIRRLEISDDERIAIERADR